jgi:8-oxo-dGTP diphosphatase
MSVAKNPRIRAGGFIWREHQGLLEVILMRRIRADRGEYYVIPGGSVEPGEPIKTAAARELLEETNVRFILQEELYQSHNPASRRIGHYFLARWLSGEPSLHPYSPEMMERKDSSNQYHPEWVRLSEVSSLALFPTAVRLRLANDLLEGYVGVIQLEETD